MSTETLVDHVTEIFASKIPFNKVCGFEFEKSGEGGVRLGFDMRDDLVGNYARGNLHGGVISSSLDAIGGLVAFSEMIRKLAAEGSEIGPEQLAKIGTIDLRVDYLRPGLGKRFTATAFVLRTGSKVAVTRMELHNDEQTLIAVGTGAYIVG